MSIIKDSKQHLEDSQKTYRQHLDGAFYYGMKLIIGGIASFIHGIFPFLLRGTAALIIIDTFYDELYNHKNKEYQDYMKAKRELK